jgi:hypothetical protein
MFAKLKDGRYLNALRPLRSHILQRYLHRGNRYLLARSMSPDPSLFTTWFLFGSAEP